MSTEMAYCTLEDLETMLHPTHLVARPTCAQCKRGVDSFTEIYDDFLERWTLTAKCHGDTQRVEFSRSDLENMTDHNVHFGEAFVSAPQLGPKL